MNQIDVSVVIVCMNNMRQLQDCLNSIIKFTTKVSYEIIVVAYFFDKENLNRLYNEFPNVNVIVSNEIRGFSANNNLGLNIAKGRYCYVLNDDTYFNTPVIDDLCKVLDNHCEISLVSPQILRPDGSIQYTGIPPITWIDWLLILFKFKREREDRTGQYIQKKGLFKTYNILGAAFLIRTALFKELGFLDERYFFGPEDKALSTLMNKKGYTCYVDASIKITHLGGATGGPTTRTVCATRPAERKGAVIFYSDNNRIKQFILECFVFFNSLMWSIGWGLKYLLGNKNSKYSFVANINVCRTIFSTMSTTQIFKKFYLKK